MKARNFYQLFAAGFVEKTLDDHLYVPLSKIFYF